jgi:hypothetical protein
MSLKREGCLLIVIDFNTIVESSPQLHAGTKRKFELNQEERQRAVDKEKEEALRKINEARSEEAKPKLPSFWLVSMMPYESLMFFNPLLLSRLGSLRLPQMQERVKRRIDQKRNRQCV